MRELIVKGEAHSGGWFCGVFLRKTEDGKTTTVDWLKPVSATVDEWEVRVELDKCPSHAIHMSKGGEV